jgi:mRNA interferase MazF
MVMSKSYIPQRGDLIWINMQPQAGHEQSGRRPAIVLSPKIYNEKVGLAILCPITSQRKEYPFEVALPDGLKIAGVILSDQVKSLDWNVRNAEFCGRVPGYITEEVLMKINTLLQI